MCLSFKVTTCHTAALGYFNWNPQASVVFENGEYWGEDSGINADTGISVPHGDGKQKIWIEIYSILLTLLICFDM